MYCTEIRGIRDGYHKLCRRLNQLGERQETRNGPVLAMPDPTMIVVQNPKHRVLFDRERDANPVFHLMEALWMLAGRNDVGFVQQFNSNIGSYSDDGTSFNAAYGHRWAEHFGYDQLSRCVEMLKANPQDRRVVMGMWDPRIDLGSSSKDIPCNTQVMFRVSRGSLNMTTVNRSNDLIWGLMGANYVHMSIMHEWTAAAIGLHMRSDRDGGGTWYHMSNNLHVYERHWEMIRAIQPDALIQCYDYEEYATVTDADLFRHECRGLAEGSETGFLDPFFQGTVEPMLKAWRLWKAGDKRGAVMAASKITAWDWRCATIAWFGRRMK
jgi:thymidylate synthase